MKIAICDDDKQDLLQIRQFVDEFLSCDFVEGKIIFLTSSQEFAIESYSVGAFNYLLKPIQKNKLFSVLGKAINDIYSGIKKYIIVKTRIGMFKLFIHELIYIDVIKTTIFFHQTNGVVIESVGTLSKAEVVLLTDKRFIKPHRSYIINLDYIKNLSQDGFTTTSNQFIPISRNVFKEVKQTYINYCVYSTCIYNIVMH